MPTTKPIKHKPAAQVPFQGLSGWGGKRRGAGRKNKTGLVNHMKREKVDFKRPLHLTLRIRDLKLNLRCSQVLAEFARCSEMAQAQGLRILHFSLQRDHLHLMVEVSRNEALAAGMRSFGCAFAKAMRKILGGRGPIFAGRYHLHNLKTPTETRNALGYVLQNQAKHSRLLAHIDRYSSALYFSSWRELYGRKMSPILDGHRAAPLPTFLSPPKSWLARTGWARGGPT